MVWENYTTSYHREEAEYQPSCNFAGGAPAGISLAPGHVVEEDLKIGKFAKRSLKQPIGENFYELFFKGQLARRGYE